MNTSELPIKNVRTIRALVGEAPASFAEMAEAANLCFIEEASEAGTRFIIDFADVPLADQSHPLIQQLAAVSEDPKNDEFWQIWLETN